MFRPDDALSSRHARQLGPMPNCLAGAPHNALKSREKSSGPGFAWRTCYEGGRTMNRLALTLLATLAIAGFARQAAAQTTPTGSAFSQNLEVWVDNKELKNEQIVYINNTQCETDTEFRFRGFNYNTGGNTISTLEIWASSGTGTNCQTASNRAKNSTTTAQCWLVAEVQSVTTSFNAPGADPTDEEKIFAPEIFKAGADGAGEECPSVTNTTYTVYFVPLATPTANNPSNPPEPIAGVQQLKATFTLNTLAPSAPAGVKATDGQTELKLEWAKAAGAMARSSYYVLWDLGVGDNSSCSNTMLTKGQAPPDPAEDNLLLQSDSTPGTAMTLGHLDERGVELYDYVAAAVVHTDISGNVSTLSTVRCLQRAETCGFDCQCAMDPECAGGFHSCALTPGARASGALLGALVALGSTLFLRRRRA
ncbi:MAG TPA: hypothetical protein VFZ61_31645 [Polyangiales bacterium]